MHLDLWHVSHECSGMWQGSPSKCQGARGGGRSPPVFMGTAVTVVVPADPPFPVHYVSPVILLATQFPFNRKLFC